MEADIFPNLNSTNTEIAETIPTYIQNNALSLPNENQTIAINKTNDIKETAIEVISLNIF